MEAMVYDTFGVGVPCDELVNGSSNHNQPNEVLDDFRKRPNDDDEFSSHDKEARYEKLMEDCGKRAIS